MPLKSTPGLRMVQLLSLLVSFSLMVLTMVVGTLIVVSKVSTVANGLILAGSMGIQAGTVNTGLALNIAFSVTGYCFLVAIMVSVITVIEHKVFLIISIVLLVLGCLGATAGAIFMFITATSSTTTLSSVFERIMKNKQREYLNHTGLTFADRTLFVDNIQIEGECCGFGGYKDYMIAASEAKGLPFYLFRDSLSTSEDDESIPYFYGLDNERVETDTDDSAEAPLGNECHKLEVPPSCCKPNKLFKKFNNLAQQLNCACDIRSKKKNHDLYQDGCQSNIADVVNKTSRAVAFMQIIILAVLIVLLVLQLLMLKNIVPALTHEQIAKRDQQNIEKAVKNAQKKKEAEKKKKPKSEPKKKKKSDKKKDKKKNKR